ncbi:MAG TPA: hypothetical protein VKF38_10135 [Anaerolineaceae bacterium]|nr:hypothetical protein [Anaerolineaceae bacterium]
MFLAFCMGFWTVYLNAFLKQPLIIVGDFYTRLGIHPTSQATLLEKILQTWDAAKLNNIELAVAIGFPIFVLFVLMGLRSVIHVIRRKPDPTAAVNSSLFLSYVALNSIRVVLGEAARLWMFWVPIMAIMAMQYMLPITRRVRWIILGLVILRVITVLLTYQFQDYLMPQLLPKNPKSWQYPIKYISTIFTSICNDSSGGVYSSVAVLCDIRDVIEQEEITWQEYRMK